MTPKQQMRLRGWVLYDDIYGTQLVGWASKEGLSDSPSDDRDFTSWDAMDLKERNVRPLYRKWGQLPKSLQKELQCVVGITKYTYDEVLSIAFGEEA